MKHVSVFVLAAILGIAQVGRADSTHTTTSGGDVNVTANGGNGGSASANGGSSRSDSDATGIGFGGSASNRTDVDTDVKNTNVNTAVSGASSNQKQGQGQFQGQDQGQNQGISAFNGNTTIVNPNVKTDVKFDSRDLRDHASSAPEARGASSDGETPCGDVSGVSAQGGLFGGGFAMPSVACQTYRHEVLQDKYGDRASAVAETVLFWFPGTLVRIVTYPISH